MTCAKEHFGGSWLAAFAIIDGAGWAAIVQEPQDAALSPVEDMKQGLVRSGAGLAEGRLVAQATAA